MKDFDPNDEAEAHHLLEALWLHQQHNVRNEELLNTLLEFEGEACGGGRQDGPALLAQRRFRSQRICRSRRNRVRSSSIPPKHLSPEDQKVYKLGAEVFNAESHCATCHLTHGKGNGNVYPSLVGSPWVNGSEERLIKMALHGMWGKITVNGKTYDPARGVPPMTAFRTLLKDDELAAVLTFVRNTWDNQASPISPELVKKVREETIDRTTFWKPDELLAEHPLEAELVLKDIGIDPEGFSNKELEDELLSATPAELAQAAMPKEISSAVRHCSTNRPRPVLPATILRRGQFVLARI